MTLIKVEVGFVVSMTGLVDFSCIIEGGVVLIIVVSLFLKKVEVVLEISMNCWVWLSFITKRVDVLRYEYSISRFVVINVKLMSVSFVLKILDEIDWLFELIEVEEELGIVKSIFELIIVEENRLLLIIVDLIFDVNMEEDWLNILFFIFEVI